MGTAEKRPWKWEENGMTVVRSIARTGPGCHEGCGVLLYVKEGKLVKVEGDREFPLTQGRLCPRCLALTQVVYHPDRLKYPLKRVGERGEGKWERITWEEAYGTITAKFNEIKKVYGPESVIFCYGTGRDILPYIDRLAFTFGSPNRVCFGPLDGHACFAPKTNLMKALFGSPAVTDCAQSFPERYGSPSWNVPECVIIWGNEPTTSSPDGFMGHWLVECMKRGSKIIVVDPRKTWLASRAKIWMQIRPGTDAALALGMLNVIINEKLYDEDFVRKWTYGFDELKARVQEYPPERVAGITWIPREQIIEAARMYATGKPAAIQFGVALEQSKECLSTIHGLIALWTVTGNLEVPGGNVILGPNFNVTPGIRRWGSENLSEEQNKRRIGINRYPFLDWSDFASGQAVIDQMLSNVPYPVKAAWIQTTNTFACGTANPKKIFQAFKELDFNVVVDLFMTPTAMAFADIVLPAATYPERDGIQAGILSICTGAINKAIEPIGECKSDMEINFELGKRLNPEAWPWENVQEMFSSMIKPAGVTFEELRDKGWIYDTFEYKKHEKGLLRPDRKAGFNTTTGKVELYSTVLEKCDLDALPYFEEPPESPVNTPDIAKDYPLVMTTGARTKGSFHSEHRQIPSLRRMNPDPIVEINPETAEKLTIKDGDWVYIESKYGRCKQKAKIIEGIDPRVISAQHGWWFPEQSGAEPNLFGAWQSNINLLLPSGWTGRSGFGYPFKNQMCRVYKVEED